MTATPAAHVQIWGTSINTGAFTRLGEVGGHSSVVQSCCDVFLEADPSVTYDARKKETWLSCFGSEAGGDNALLTDSYHIIANTGAFVGPDGKTLPVPEGLPNAHMRLFGGAQYHRAMAEFRAGIGELTCPDISREEIVNACGIDDFHDGVNYTRTACVIAVSKARDMFEPFLHQVVLIDQVEALLLPVFVLLCPPCA
jgi:hypothetical protein